MVLSLVATPNGLILIQVARLNAATRERQRAQVIAERLTYVVSAETGGGAKLGVTLPWILAATDSVLWGWDEAPKGYPIIVGFRY